MENRNITLNTIVRDVDGDNKNSILVSPTQLQLFQEKLRNRVKSYTTDKQTDKILAVTRQHLMDGLVVSNFFTCMEYQNILFVPSYKNSKYANGLLDANYRMQKPNAGQHMAPIINKRFDCAPNICVAYPEGHTSLYHDLMLDFGVKMIQSSAMYGLGMEDYTITPPDGVKFDCVYFVGHGVEQGTSFNANDIKADFAPYCTEDFDLVDHYASEATALAVQRDTELPEKQPRLVGETKDLSELMEFLTTNTLRQDNFQNQLPSRHRERMVEILSHVIKVY